MRFGDFGWLFFILLIGGMFLFRGCWGWGGCCGIPRWARRFNRDFNNESEAIKILNKRYAQGEISEADYERMKQKINERL